jgi:hypothetical protein
MRLQAPPSTPIQRAARTPFELWPSWIESGMSSSPDHCAGAGKTKSNRLQTLLAGAGKARDGARSGQMASLIWIAE